MPKKMDEAEVKKECPSCGLGVSLESRTCEFCGWDFEEEDEWILQIEKLERDLMIEKQKLEPGTVDEKIESTLHSPAQMYRAEEKTTHVGPAEPEKKEPAPTIKRGRAAEATKPVPSAAPAPQRSVPVKQESANLEHREPSAATVQEPVARKPSPLRQVASQPITQAASESAAEEASSPAVRQRRIAGVAPARETAESKTTKRRLVRKVKGKD